jgi:hypothetical protein
MAPEWLNAAMRKSRVPLVTAAEDIHPVYKSPRLNQRNAKTFTKTIQMSFVIKFNVLSVCGGQLGQWRGFLLQQD